MKCIYDSRLLYIDGNHKRSGVTSLQTNNTLIQANDIFAAGKKKELKKAKLVGKNREKLILHTPIKFNGGYLKLAKDYSLFLSQK